MEHSNGPTGRRVWRTLWWEKALTYQNFICSAPTRLGDSKLHHARVQEDDRGSSDESGAESGAGTLVLYYK